MSCICIAENYRLTAGIFRYAFTFWIDINIHHTAKNNMAAHYADLTYIYGIAPAKL